MADLRMTGQSLHGYPTIFVSVVPVEIVSQAYQRSGCRFPLHDGNGAELPLRRHIVARTCRSSDHSVPESAVFAAFSPSFRYYNDSFPKSIPRFPVSTCIPICEWYDRCRAKVTTEVMMRLQCPPDVLEAIREEQRRLHCLDEWRLDEEERLRERMIRDLSARLRWGGDRDD